MNKTNLSSSTECHCIKIWGKACTDCNEGRHQEDCLRDTTTQGDDSMKELDELLESWNIPQHRIGMIRGFFQSQHSKTLKKTIIRFKLLEGRMRACEEEHPDTHKVSLIEIPGWIEELEAEQKGKSNE